MSSKNDKKKKKGKRDFAGTFAEKLKESKIGLVSEGAHGDMSARWVTLRIKNEELYFSFDIKGEKILSLGLFQDEVKVVDQIKIFGSETPTDKKKS